VLFANCFDFQGQKNNSCETKKSNQKQMVSEWRTGYRTKACAARRLRRCKDKQVINLQSYQISLKRFVGCSSAEFPDGDPCGQTGKHAPQGTCESHRK